MMIENLNAIATIFTMGHAANTYDVACGADAYLIRGFTNSYFMIVREFFLLLR
jgi:hypothetical protein